MKHTPGPWIAWGHVVAARADQTLIADLRRKPAASAFDSHIGNLHIPFEEISANADLIAAAPVMYEALSPFAVRHDRIICEEAGTRPLKVLVPFTWLEEARAALAAARGES